MASKSSIEAGKGHVSLGTNDSALTKGLADAQKKFQDWGKGIATIGAGIAAAGASVTAPFLAGLAIFQAWGAEMRGGMRETGIGFQQLDYLMDSLNVSVEELGPAVAKMSSFLVDAAGGSATANAALQQLGLSISDLTAMSQGDRVQAIAEALGNIADASQRISLQRDILALNITGGAAGMRARAERRDYIEGKPTEGDMELAASTGKLFKEMALAIKGIWREIGAAAAPVMKDFYQLVISVLVPIREFVTANRAVFTVVFAVADKVVLLGSAIVFLGGIVYGASYGFAFLSGIITITGAALGALWGWTVFAASGFGILKVFALGYAAVMLGVNAVVWLGNLAHAAGTAALAFFTGGLGITTGATGGFSLALAVAWVLENLVTGGLWLLTAAVGALAIAFLAAAGVAPIVLFGILVYLLARFIAGNDAAKEAWGQMTAAISVAAGDAWESCKRAFAGIFDTVKTTMGGVMDSIRTGDWAGAWEIIKTGGMLAWTQLTVFVAEQFVIWKYAAFDVWNQIADGLYDAFASAMTLIELRLARLLGQATEGIKAAAEAARVERDAARAQRDQGLAADRAGALAGTASPEIAALQQRLAMLTFWAEEAASDAAAGLGRAGGGGGPEGLGGGAFKGGATGTFFADVAAGWLGSSGGATPMERIGNLQLTEAQRHTVLLQRLLDEGGGLVV